jgi:hypothetical protein
VRQEDRTETKDNTKHSVCHHHQPQPYYMQDHSERGEDTFFYELLKYYLFLITAFYTTVSVMNTKYFTTEYSLYIAKQLSPKSPDLHCPAAYMGHSADVDVLSFMLSQKLHEKLIPHRGIISP